MNNFNEPILLQNGKIFPSWIMYKYNKYMFKPSSVEEDVCNPTIKKKQLRPYQQFISKYLDYNSQFNSILLYHGVGSGKTATTIEVYNNLYKYSDLWNVIILLKSSIKSEWLSELNKWLSMDEKDNRIRDIKFISYNSPTAWQHFQEIHKSIDTNKKNFYIIDEAHNFIRAVYNSVVNMKIGQSLQIYNALLSEKKDNIGTRIIAISATPGINSPFEFSLLFNLLKPGVLPEKEAEFNNIFLTTDNNLAPEEEKKYTVSQDKLNLFQRRILGLVSYFDSSDPAAFAKKNIHYINIKMRTYQKSIYDVFAAKEAKQIQKNKKFNKLYRVYTRNACNFVFPTIHNINGTSRPRPNDFNLSEKDVDDFMKGKENKELTERNIFNINKEKYELALKKYIDTVKEYFDEVNEEDKKNNHTVLQDFDNLIKIYQELQNKQLSNEQVQKNKSDTIKANKIIEKYIKENKASHLLIELYKYSPKYTCMMLYLYNSPGPTIIYTTYVRMEGIATLKIYLSCFGFINYDTKKINQKDDYKRYAEYNGTIEDKVRTLYKEIYNKEENKHGKLIKAILLSQAGSEGITLLNVRQIHIAEPHWNEALMEQVIGRGVRRCSHKLLPKEERVVDIYRYKMTFGKKNIDNKTTDEYIEELAKNKENTINQFLHAIKEVAVDCELNKQNNIINNKDLKCFNFDESSLLTKDILPAYRERIDEDLLINSGLNANNNIVKTETVYKISAVILEDIDNNIYSQPDFYWLNKTSGAVYNYNYKYLVGKIKYHKENDELIFEQDENNNFIIDFLTPYPGLNKKKK